MPDNVEITPGSGVVVATDDVAGIHYQRFKLSDGTGDATTHIAAGNGAAANALRVTLASDGTGVVAATQSGAWTVAATQSGAWSVAQSGAWSVSVTGSVAVTGTFWQATQPVSIAAAVKTTDNTTRLGVYYYHSGALVVGAAADSAATAGGGRLWLQNPVGSAVTLRVRSIKFKSQLGSALAAVTSPRITLEKGIFTGTASGATVTATKRKTSDSNATGTLRTAVTGMTISSSTVVCAFFPVASATAVSYNTPAIDEFNPGPEDYIDLAPGELLVIRQADAGTTSDTRRFTVDFVVEEI